MEVFTGNTAFAAHIAKHLPEASFTLVDIGCGGGLHRTWRSLGSALRGIGFDVDAQDMARLAAAETNANIRYIAAQVAAPPDHPIRSARGNPWGRLAVARTLAIRASKPPEQESSAAPAGKGPPTIDIAGYLHEHGYGEPDFIKIDIDGDDFAVLCALERVVRKPGVLGVGMEVNFFGTDHESDHSFHNTDRFLRRAGFELFDLSMRRYPTDALPGRYSADVPGPAQFGRSLQGDALYLRDVCADKHSPLVADPTKLAKLAILFSLCAAPDGAAEILVRHRAVLSRLFDVDAALDILTRAVRLEDMPSTYRDYMAAFEADAPAFYTRHAPSSPDPRREGALIEHVAALEAEVRALRASTSWRVTAPLRAAVAALRGH